MNAIDSADVAPAVTIRKPDEGESIWFLDNHLSIKASSQDGAGFSLMVNSMPQGSHTPFHRHESEDEAFYVLQGRLTIFLDDREVEVGPGDFVHLPAGTAHGFRTQTAVRMLVICVGEGFFEMVREAGDPAPAPELPPQTPHDKARLTAACDRHAITILGPLPG